MFYGEAMNEIVNERQFLNQRNLLEFLEELIVVAVDLNHKFLLIK